MELEVPASVGFSLVLSTFSAGLDSEELFWRSEFPEKENKYIYKTFNV